MVSGQLLVISYWQLTTKIQFSKNEKNSPKTEKLPLIKKEDIYMTIEQIIHLRETEDKVEFKEAKTQYTYNKERRSTLGYVVALANECGGKLILGVKENKSLL